MKYIPDFKSDLIQSIILPIFYMNYMTNSDYLCQEMYLLLLSINKPISALHHQTHLFCDEIILDHYHKKDSSPKNENDFMNYLILFQTRKTFVHLWITNEDILDELSDPA